MKPCTVPAAVMMIALTLTEVIAGSPESTTPKTTDALFDTAFQHG